MQLSVPPGLSLPELLRLGVGHTSGEAEIPFHAVQRHCARTVLIETQHSGRIHVVYVHVCVRRN